MGAVALDASLLIGFLDPGDALHEACAAALRQHAGNELVLPASAYAELLVGPSRAGRRAVERAEAAIGELGIAILPLDRETARAAARLRARHAALRLPDALVLGAAEVSGCDVLLTGDARWSKVSRRVRVVRAG